MQVTKEDIKNSVEVKWSKKQIKIYLGLYLFLLFASLIIALFSRILVGIEYLDTAILIFLGISLGFIAF